MSGRSNHVIRILLVVSNLEYGGAQRQIIELANGIDRSRFQVHICSLSDYTPLAKEFLDASTRLHVIKKRFKFDISVIPRLYHLLRSLNINIIHSFLFDAEIASRFAGRLAGVAAVVGSERNTDYQLKRRQLIAYRLTKRFVDLIIANSEAGAHFGSSKLGYDLSMYKVLHNGVDVAKFAPQDKNGVRKLLGFSNSTPVVGMFASFKEQKNHPLFFAAAKKIVNRVPGVRFLLVGDMLYAGMHGSGKYKRRIDRMVDELDLKRRCLFLGNRNDVADLYCACDVTVLPSLFEGTPNVILESMACGVPVIATNVSDNAQIVENGKAGYLIDSGDEQSLADRLVSLLNNCDERRRMGNIGRELVVQKFSTSVLLRKIEQIYLDLIM